jgi:hypothetical protein
MEVNSASQIVNIFNTILLSLAQVQLAIMLAIYASYKIKNVIVQIQSNTSVISETTEYAILLVSTIKHTTSQMMYPKKNVYQDVKVWEQQHIHSSVLTQLGLAQISTSSYTQVVPPWLHQ